MVKLGRGGRRHLPHRPEPMPLFPPGELPVFGPPPVNHRRPPPPRRGFPPPISRPPPPLMRPPPPLRLCPPPPSFPPGQRRQGHLIPPVRPLLQTPILPPRGVPFGRGMPVRGIPLRGRGRGGPFNRQGKNMKKMKNKKMNKPSKEANAKKDNGKIVEKGNSEKISEGPWITEEIQKDIERVDLLKKQADEKKDDDSVNIYNEEKKKLDEIIGGAKKSYESQKVASNEVTSEVDNGTAEQK